MEHKAYVIYRSQSALIRKLSREQKGLLFEAIIQYQEDGTIIVMDDLATEIVFEAIRNQFDIDRDKYDKRVKANQENGRTGGRPRRNENPPEPNDEKINQEKAKESDKNPLGFMGYSENPPEPNESEWLNLEPKKPIEDEDEDEDEDKKRKKTSQKNFSDFWGLCPKKIKRLDAEKKFIALPEKEQTEAIEGMKRYGQYWVVNKTELQYIPAPVVWINQKRWLDEIDLTPPKPRNTPQNALVGAKKDYSLPTTPGK